VLLTELRWGEAVALEEADVAGDVLHVRRTLTRAGTVNAPKTRAGARAVPLSPRARAILDGLDLPVGGDYRRARDALVAAMGDLHRPGWAGTASATPTPACSTPPGCL
jgi:integrase